MDRETRCILSWDVVKERTSDVVQACLDRAPQARQYYSDAFPVYDTLYYGAPNELRNDKKETYSVEGVMPNYDIISNAWHGVRVVSLAVRMR